MRLVIDLQACQDGSHTLPSSPAAQALAQAQELARSAGTHEVWIVLQAGQPDQLEQLRAAFSGLLPSGQVRTYDVPLTKDATPWQRRAAELVRDNFLLGLAPDLVYTPALFESDSGTPVCAARPLAGLRTVFSLESDTLLAAPKNANAAQLESWQRLQTSLRTADLLLAATPALAQRLQTACDKQPQQLAVLPATPQLWQLFDAVAAQPSPAEAATRRPRLAYLSPLPPERSGIADYSADVIPALAQYYDIELIAEQDSISDIALSANFPLRTPTWFDEHAHEFDRIVYHFGNNHMHRYMFDMLQRHPGVVILHDFYLSGVVDQMERGGYQDSAFFQALYQSHGYKGLLEQQRLGRNDTIWAFPTNKAVLDQAAGVIVHSAFACQLAARWYGADYPAQWRTAPLPRRPLAQQIGASTAERRAAARSRLGLGPNDFVVSTFGMLGATKLNAELIAAFEASPLGSDAHCRLLFVGQNASTDYGYDIERQIASSPARERIGITGFVSAEQYADYAAATDIAVQLRSMTRGETSAAILDCMLYGAPTIINAHGAGAELPDSALLKLPDACSVAELSAALTLLHGDPALRQRLGEAAAGLIRSDHSPAAAAHCYHEAIEHFATQHTRSRYRALTLALARVATPAPGPAELLSAARAIAYNQAPTAPRQLFVDVSALMDTDLKTGIQRVVRSVLQVLIDQPPPGYRVEPVYGNGGNRPYRYARRFMLELLGVSELQMEDAPIEARHGDIFLGLDLFTNGTSQNRQLLLDMRKRGIAVYFVVYDILPMLRPEWFPHGTEDYFGIYLDTVTHAANGIICISRAVADELAAWTATRPQLRRAPLQLGYFHLGADIDASKPSFGLPPNADHVFASVAARPSVLMVGTLEPRKGHALALAAFDLLWEQGEQVNLVIVGKEGWMVDALAQRLKQHPQREQHLFWLPGVSDEMLQRLYKEASGLLAASEGEGFGLPLIEAAQQGIPILARDLPVFREVAQGHASYFTAATPAELAATLHQWLAALQAGTAPDSRALPWLTWNDSAQQLLDVVLQQQWYKELPGGSDTTH